ncbi:zinc transporter ZupT [Flavobacteriales bacterium]|jgi:ZIP family zinc transporter|nr:zinc transporter ZupT [Flavobacteriales bacterium]
MEQSYLIPFLITLFAGLSTSIGGLVVFFGNTEKLNWLSFTMSFAAGVMLYVSFVEILPESFIEFKQSHETNRAFLYVFSFFIIGVFFAILTDKLLPEQKINSQVNKSLISKNNKIYRSGLLITLTMALHNFPEGMVTFIGSVNDLSFGLVIGFAIALHNIPEGMAISVPIYHATGSKRKAFLYATLSGLTEPLGALFCYFVINSFLDAFLTAAIMSVVSGIMIFISIFVLLPLSYQYKGKLEHVIGLFTGMFVIGISIYLM